MSDEPPYFDVQAAYLCKANCLYRIFVEDDALTFVWAGAPGNDFGAAGQAGGAAGGLVGALVGAMLQKALSSAGQTSARRQTLSESTFEELRGDHRENFVVPVDDVLSARIAAPSAWHAAQYSDPLHKSLLTLKHRTLGKFRLGICTEEGLQTAIEELPPLLGDRCQADFVWSEFSQSYRPKR